MKLFALSVRLDGLGPPASQFAGMLLAALLVCPIVVVAQEPESPQTEEGTAPEDKSPGDAGAAVTEIERMVASLDQEALVAELRARLESAEQRLSEEVAGRLQEIPIDQVDRSRLDSVLRMLPRFRSSLAELQRDLNAAIAVTDAAQESLRQTEDTWTTTLEDTDREDLPPELADLIERVITQAMAGRQLASERLGDLVAIETRALEFRSKLDSLAAEAETRERSLLADIFRRDAKPAWTALAGLGGDSTTAGVAAAADAVMFGLKDLGGAHGSRLMGHGVGALILLIMLLIARRNSALLARLGDSSAKRVLDHPIALTVVLTLALTQPLYPTAQPSVLIINTIIFIAAELVVLSAILSNVRWWLMSLVGAYLMSVTAIYLLPFDTPLQRLALFAGALAGILLMIATWRFCNERIRSGRWRAVAGYLLLALAFLLATAVAANLVGAVAYAGFIVEAVVRCYLAALGLLTLSFVARDFVEIVLDSKLVGFLRSVQQSKESIAVLLRKAITVLAVFLWLWAALNAFRLLDPALEGVRAALSASWTIGMATISVGKIAIFVFSVWLAVYVSRVIRFFLDEDLLPRLSLPRGVPAAISTGTHYLIISGALVFGTAAAGLDLTKLAIVVGALSVGIGFGLQNIVNNFVSGLILLFERPIQVGDHVQVGQLMGRVSRIGIRASTVRLYEGSEVIVPNGDLISQQVINHTLSDRDRRLELLVGVAYGTDLEKAQAVIEDAVKSNSLVSSDPPPMILFTEFGESSLDFRVLFWIDDFEIGLKTRSDVGIAINQALARAGIEIPFPQRVVYQRSSAPADTVDADAETTPGRPD